MINLKNVTNEYRKSVVSNREFLYEAKITFADGNALTLNDKDDLKGDGIIVASGTSGTDSFDIGAAVIGELAMNLNNTTEKFDTYNFLDAQISLKIGLVLDNTVEYLQMGLYTVEEAKAVETTITLSALDKMSWFEKKYSEVHSVYPRSLYWIVRDICDCCGVPLSGTSFPGGDRIIPRRPEDPELDCLQMISYAAQVAGCYAVITENGSLAFRWYDTSVFEEMDSLDGGRLKNKETGDQADGGNFTDHSSGDAVDGGTFTDQRRYAHIYAMNSMQVATDEIVITGIRVAADEEEMEDIEDEDITETEELQETEEDPEENKGFLCGEEGYVLLVSENPLITEGMEESIARELGNKIIGMKIRKFSVNALSDPAIEAGDCAYISDRKGNSYPVYITNTVFKMGDYEEFSCGAQSPAKNRTGGSIADTRAIIRARKEIKKQLTAYDTAVQQLTELMANSFGVFKTEERKLDGSFIYYMHDKPSLEESKTIWKMVSGALAVSTDGGKTWNAGMTAEGNMIVKVLSAIGINADWINAGEISSASINIGNSSFTVDKEGNVKITKGSITIGNGAFSVDADGNMTSNDATITGEIIGIDGFSLKYENKSFRPAITGSFVYAGVGYDNPSGGGVSNDAYLNLYSPHGTRCIVMGVGGYAEGADGLPKLKDTVFFPNGAIISKAVLKSLEQTFIKSETIGNRTEWVEFKVRTSGVFVCVYGTYHTYGQMAWERKDITVGEASDPYVPNYASVKTVGRSGKSVFVFVLSTKGVFTARNASEIDFSSETAAGISFRFDFCRF